jgi:plasmid stabilization system protein ParE
MYYVLSPKADNDIEDIFDYTEFEYGLQKAIEYTTEFLQNWRNHQSWAELERKSK